jgi:TonB family protein
MARIVDITWFICILVAFALLTSVVHAKDPVQAWKQHIIETLDRSKCYPNTKNSGVVRVHFEVDRTGRTVSAKVVNSSGHEELDEAALVLVDQVFQAPPLEISGSRISLQIPVRFNLKGFSEIPEARRCKSTPTS